MLIYGMVDKVIFMFQGCFQLSFILQNMVLQKFFNKNSVLFRIQFTVLSDYSFYFQIQLWLFLEIFKMIQTETILHLKTFFKGEKILQYLSDVGIIVKLNTKNLESFEKNVVPMLHQVTEIQKHQFTV